MTKTYINSAIVGNSHMLGCITDKGELVRLFWPNIDYPQHIERMAVGIFTIQNRHSTEWLEGEAFEHSQSYIDDTNILRTEYINKEKTLKIIQLDFVMHHRDILIRSYDVENIGEKDVDIGIVIYSSCVTTTPMLCSTLFDFPNDALIHYRHGYYLAVSSDCDVQQFQLGNNAYESACRAELHGYDSIAMMNDGALSYKLGVIKAGESKAFNMHICVSETLKGVKESVKYIKSADLDTEYDNTKKYWANFLNSTKQIKTDNEIVNSLCRRSLLVFSLMADGKSGGLLAAPEIDEGFTKCGRYAYCWGRDAAFITAALDKTGLTDTVDNFYNWAKDVQDEDGSWLQRYHLDGNLAPSWGLQIDETGTLIWGMLKHYQETLKIDFLEKMWSSVEKGVEFLLNFIDTDTGLPLPSYDLWEERVGEHTYSAAAVCAGIKAATEIAALLEKPKETVAKWERAGNALKEAIVNNLWKDENECFLRSIRTKLNTWGNEHSENTVNIKVNSKNYFREVTMEDRTIDVSVLGVCIPFDIMGADDFRVTKSVGEIERILTSTKVGGIKRYENDNYIGGNPWVLTTLWVALFHIRRKDFSKGKKYFDWAVNATTELGLLPEQVNKETGKSEWVIPLTWSHAMFVLVLFELVENGAI